MARQAWRLTDADVRVWLNGLLQSGVRVIAPVAEGDLLLFRPISSAQEVLLAPGKTQWSPKEYLFPRTEPLFSYVVQDGTVRLEDPAVTAEEQVLFGLRPCDAAGLSRLDAVFLSGERDPFYARRRAATTVVTVGCAEAAPECFCAAVGGSPLGEEGSDVQMLPLENAWLVAPLTAKGEALTGNGFRQGAPVAPEEWAQAEEHGQQLAARIARSRVAQEWAAALERSFDSPLWEALGQRCLGCSICSSVCPSCSCFDVQDEGNAMCGVRCRAWDSCTFTLFTQHASGHNPRPSQAARYRQRVLHKFAYFPLQHDGQFMCVGCGRCLKLCPVGMDIRTTVEAVMSLAQGGNDG